MFQFFSSFGASSNFQKHRLILTAKTYQAPDENSLKKLIATFRGEDQQTRAQIAFATIMKKIYTSDSCDNWIYLLKNLIIFDRVVEENCFIDQIATLDMQPIQNYKQKNQSAKALNSQMILKSFWKLIQYKSSLMCKKSNQNQKNFLQVHNNQQSRAKRESSFSKTSKVASNLKNQPQKKSSPQHNKVSISQSQLIYDPQRSILSVLRSQKQQFLKTLTCQQIYNQSSQLQTLFQHIFRVIGSIEGSKKIINNSSVSEYKSQNKYQNGTNLSKNINNGENLKQHHKGLSSLQSPLMSEFSSNQQNNVLHQKYKVVREQFFNSKLVNYLHLQMLYKVLTLYTNQLFCIKAFINHLSQTGNSLSNFELFSTPEKIRNLRNSLKGLQPLSQKQINIWKKTISNYLAYSERIIGYVERHKYIKGFEVINYNQLSPFQNINIIEMLDNYIQHKNTLEEPDIVKVQQLGTINGKDNNQIKVQKKGQWSYQKALTARKNVSIHRNLKQKNNAFYNWQNSYSHNFPPKQILTVDLIVELRQKESKLGQKSGESVYSEDDQEQSIYQPFIVNRHSCILNYRDSNISAHSEFQFIPLQELQKKQEQQLQSKVTNKTTNFYYFKSLDNQKQFRNIYSSLSSNKQAESGGTIWIK